MFSKTKTILATLATGAAMVAAASPAMAQHGYGHNGGWNNGGNSRQAINACSRVAERSAERNGYRRATVSDIRDVRDTRRGFEVRGRLNVSAQHGGWRDGGRHWDDRGYNNYGNRYGRDRGAFTCRFERGRVVALDIDGIRGL